MKKLALSFLLIAVATIAKSQSTATLASLCGENVVITNSTTPSAQNVLPMYTTPGNYFDNIFDRFGNAYSYQDIAIDLGTGVGNKPIQANSFCQAGYFKLYFATGSGMEPVPNNSTQNAINLARQAVLCDVFKDISNFINTTFVNTSTVNNVFVNILVDDPNTVANPAQTSDFLGTCSPYYVFPLSPTSSTPGIIDNQIYKTIISEKDAYDNVLAPITLSSSFYHGLVCFNFVNPNFVWNLSTSTCPAGQYDMYSIALHEILHGLGFASLIDGNGTSKFGSANNYYARYDTYLRRLSANLITSTLTSCSSAYGYKFALPSQSIQILGAPNCTSNPQDFTNCNNACYYLSTNVPSSVTVFNPNCYEPGSTLSHFEDMCYPTNTPSNNNQYFAMSNAYYPGSTKRFIQPEERKVLCDLGYAVQPIFNQTPVYVGSSKNYSPSTICNTLTVFGINDGVANNAAYTFTSVSANNISIPISSIVANDSPVGSVTAVCVENVYAYTGTLTVSGNTLIFIPNPSYYGPILLKYIPQHISSGLQGGVTYIFAYVSPSTATCSPLSVCDLVQNGGFEQVTGCGYLLGNPVTTINPSSTAALNCVKSWAATPDVFVQGCSTTFPISPGTFANLNSSTYASNPTFANYSPTNTANKAVCGLAGYIQGASGPSNYHEAFFSALSSQLIPGSVYKLGFWAYQYSGIYKDVAVSNNTIASNSSSVNIPLSFATSTAFVPFNQSAGAFPTPTAFPGMIPFATVTLNSFNSWKYYSQTFTFSPSNPSCIFFYAGINGPQMGANYLSMFSVYPVGTYQYYVLLDDISIKPISIAPTFSLPSTNICPSQSYTDLAQYVSPPGGTFAASCGTCISVSGNTYNFTPPGNGVYQIVYTYTDSAPSCTQQAVAQITVSNISNLINVTQLSNFSCNFPNQTTLTASGSPGNYTWTPPGSTLNPFVMSPTVNSTITVSSSSGGCIASKTVAVNVLTLAPTLSVSATQFTICPGQSTTLTAAGNFTNAIWQSGTLTINSPTAVVFQTSTTIYTATATNSLGCSKTTILTITTVPSAPSFSISATSTSLCPNQSTTLSIVASSPANYTWTPSASNATSIVQSPTVQTTYTVVGTNSTGCVMQQTISINSYSFNPTLTLTVFPSPVCPNSTVILTANGDPTSYIWTPGNLIGSPVTATVNGPTVYTVVGTNSTNCVATGTIAVSTITAPQFFTIVATPSIVCPNNANFASTLTAIGASNYTWQPGNVVASSYTTNSSATYTCASTFTNGCIYTQTVFLGEGPTVYMTPTTICTTNTLDLSSIASPSPGGTFSLNGNPVSSVIGTLSPGIYTVTYNYTAAAVCNNDATTTINVYQFPSSPTIIPSNPVACANGSFSLEAFPSSQTYTWLPPNFVGNPYVFVPTTSQNYTVITGSEQCTLATTYSVQFDPLPCGCQNGCFSALSGIYSGGPLQSAVWCVVGDLFVNGVTTFSNSDFRIAPSVSIVVNPGATLNIYGSHLYSCGNMWSGIVVKQGGQLNILNSSTNKTSFIEDAFVGVDVEPYNINANATNILNVDNATFNKNVIGIRIGHYRRNQNNYPFSIKNTLITSRTITFTTLSWPQTNMVKMSASGGNSMQTPYISNFSYTPTGLKAPHDIIPPVTYGLIIKDVGYTTIPLGATFKDMTVGQNGGGLTSFNCFDNLNIDIFSNNSNVTIINSVFQNGLLSGKSPTPTGLGISAVASAANDVLFHNYRLQVFPGTPSGNYNNKFYDKRTCVDVVGYVSTEIKFAECYSSINDYSIPNYSNAGFNVSTNRYIKIHATDNKLYNISNSMMVSLDVGFFNVGNQVGSGRYVGSIVAAKNIIKNHITIPTAGEYINIGIAVQDPFASSPIAYSPSGVHTRIYENNITNVHNGIDVKNVSFATVDIYKNNIGLVNEPNTYVAMPTQYGINTEQCQFKAVINQNSVTGVSNYSAGVHAINTALNALMSVRCNTTSLTNRGIQFNNGQTVDVYEDNIMSNQKYGMILDNNAVLTNTLSLNVIGSISRPTNNLWTGTWTPPNYKTATFGGSSAQNGKMYIEQCNPCVLDPINSGTTSLNSNSDEYFYLPTNTLSTLLNATVSTAQSCRISNNNNNNSNNSNNAQSVLASMVSGSIIYSVNPIETQMINKHMAYRTLKVNQALLNNSSVLTNFYNNAQNTCLQQLCAIEDDLMNTNYVNAQIKINSFNPSCQIETNYKNYYQILKNTKDSTYATSDSLNLISLANQCPYIDGGVVFQARALYNILYRGYYKFAGNCSSNYSSRENNVIEDDAIGVILKSKLYPNPNNGTFKIELQGSTKSLKFTLFIYDIIGKIVFQSECPASNENVLGIDSKLLKGTYLVKVVFEDNSADIHRLIVD